MNSRPYLFRVVDELKAIKDATAMDYAEKAEISISGNAVLNPSEESISVQCYNDMDDSAHSRTSGNA